MQTLALALQRTGDSCFVLSYVLLFVKTTTPSGVAGVSLRTHELYLFNFVLRYIDVFWNFLSLYLTCIKITFLCLGVMTIACFRCTARGRETYAEELELSYRSCLYYIVTPCVLAGLIWNLDPSSPFEIGWAISRWLEALAIVPQLVLLRKRGFVDNITSHYILLLGVFRIFYSVSWTYRYVTERHYWQPIMWTAGALQSVLHFDLLIFYFRNKCCLGACCSGYSLPVSSGISAKVEVQQGSLQYEREPILA